MHVWSYRDILGLRKMQECLAYTRTIMGQHDFTTYPVPMYVQYRVVRTRLVVLLQQDRTPVGINAVGSSNLNASATRPTSGCQSA